MEFLGVRISREDLEELRRRALELRVSQSQLVRSLLADGLRSKASGSRQEIASRLDAIEERLSMMEVALRAAVRAIEMLASRADKNPAGQANPE